MRDLFVIFTVLTAGSVSSAKPEYFNILQAEVPTARLTFHCQTCHGSGGPQLNAFGHDFSAIKNQLGPNFSTQFWAQLKDLDSDHDGLTNEQELLQGRNPGVAGQ